MRKLLFLLTFIPTISFSQYNYTKPDISGIDPNTQWEITTKSPPVGYWKHYESRRQFNTGLAFVGMTGLAFYFDTLADGPYKPLGYFYGSVAVGKFIHAGILRKREKSYDEWGKYH